MTRKLRAWWKQLRNRVRAVWERFFGGERNEARAGLAAPPPEGVLEPEPSQVAEKEPVAETQAPMVDAEYEDVLSHESHEEPAELGHSPGWVSPESVEPETPEPETPEQETEVASEPPREPESNTRGQEEESVAAYGGNAEGTRTDAIDEADEPEEQEIADGPSVLDEQSMLELEALLVGSPANVDGDPPEEGRDARFIKELRRGRTVKRPPLSRERPQSAGPETLPQVPGEADEESPGAAAADAPPLEAWVDRELERIEDGEAATSPVEPTEEAPEAFATEEGVDLEAWEGALADAALSAEGDETTVAAQDSDVAEPETLDAAQPSEKDDAAGAAEVSDAVEPEGPDAGESTEPEDAALAAEASDAVEPEGQEGVESTEVDGEPVAAEPLGAEAEDAAVVSLEREEEEAAEEMAAAAAALVETEAAAMEAARLATAPKQTRRSKRMRLAEGELTAWRRLAESERKRRERARLQESLEVPNDYVPMVESRDILFQLRLSSFEGPLDLLLFLIRRHKIDVFDIPIGFICAEYLRYIKMMEDLNIDVASEFLFMASELLHIKSKMLLPKPAEVEDDDDIDPRAELVARLLEYQKYKDAAAQLHELAWLGRDRFPRAPERLPPREGEAPLKEVGVFALIEAFNRVLERQKPEVRHQVMLEQVSVRQRIKQVIQMLLGHESVEFEVLLEGLTERVDVVVSFLACLEMAKRQLLRLYLSENDTLYLHPRFEDIEAAMSRLEGLEEHEYA